MRQDLWKTLPRLYWTKAGLWEGSPSVSLPLHPKSVSQINEMTLGACVKEPHESWVTQTWGCACSKVGGGPSTAALSLPQVGGVRMPPVGSVLMSQPPHSFPCWLLDLWIQNNSLNAYKSNSHYLISSYYVITSLNYHYYSYSLKAYDYWYLFIWCISRAYYIPGTLPST